MLRVVEVKVAGETRLRARFSDGVEPDVDLAGEFHGPVFEPLTDPVRFAQVQLDEFGVICWPNGADLAPEFVLWRTRRDDPLLRDAFIARDYRDNSGCSAA